ncbi:puromycin-sensitive aminopeptidase-like [Dermatophagoides pteronyssinus]|uniref:Aminopeptidase n=1 Tax=Dermatophagoides pteronyssinus TaxID=6956 RepID=A0A6P6XWD1_DERPT|nr:puromycin-sensitive aminopeptidase-like [Dermatophagoides pteronyssinus]
MATTENKTSFQRLPCLVTPINYHIRLAPDFKKFTFEGSQSIDLKVNESTAEIVLNSDKLTIENGADQCNVKLPNDNKTINIKEIKYNVEEETATLILAEKLVPGMNAILNLEFSGELDKNLTGFYKSRYIGPDGKERFSAVTQFEPTYARKAFPCWDEPAHKATFDITLVVPVSDNDDKMVALSNMSVKEENRDSQKRRVVKFDRTPIMSTYLVAFVIGEYDYIETRSKHGVLVRVYTPLQKSEQGRFALDVAARSLDFYTDYFQIPFPLSKLDLIAISDFSAGAMENWGLVTYREVCLLVDPSHTSTSRKQSISLTVAHELAHQWFGNLVTMEWWTHLWLNEGFAMFMEYLCVDHLFPDFMIWKQFVSDTFLSAMNLDSLANSHPIEIPVGHPSEVEEIFDDISYNKGACINRMLYHYIGDENFRKGMKLYLSRHSYKNTQTEDLWNALEEASQKPVRRMMTTWTKQKGYPVVTVNCQGSNRLELTQEKFNSDGQLSDADKTMLWAVPVQVITAKDVQKPQAEILLEKRVETLELGSLIDLQKEWIKLNPFAMATYRVQYQQEDLFIRLLEEGIGQQKLDPADRLNLINDLYSMTLAGRKSSDVLFQAIGSFRNECEYSVWTVMNVILSKYNQLLYGYDFHPKFVEFGTKLITQKVFGEIGWDPKPSEPHLKTLLRPLLINRLVTFEYPEVMKKCHEAFDDHVAKRKSIPADLRSAVYRAMSSQITDEIWEKIMKLHDEAELQEEQMRIQSALGSVKKPEFIERVLKFAISDKVRSQDTIFVVASVACNPSGRRTAWEFFISNYELFKSRYDVGFLGNALIKSLIENFQTEEMAHQIEDFFRVNPNKGWDRSIQQSIETVRLNAALMARDTEKLAKFFQ